MSNRRPSPFKTLLDSELATLIQAAEGVYQIRFKNRAANAYLVRGSKRTIMIDVGLSSNYPHLLTCLAHLGVTPEMIDISITSAQPIIFMARPLSPRTGLPPTRSCCATIFRCCERCSTSRACRSMSISGWKKAI